MDNDFTNQNEGLDQVNLPPQYPQTSQAFLQKSKKWIWWFVIILILIIGGGIFYYFYFYRSGVQSGLVNKSEIGCQNSNLFVTSATGQAPVDKQGNYQTTFATASAQLVVITNDKNTLCAEAVALPKNQNKVSFNAKSTAQTMVFISIGILTTDPIQAQQRLDMIEQLNSFPALYSYVKTNLVKSDLGTLTKDTNLQTLLTNCVTEMGQKLNIIK